MWVSLIFGVEMHYNGGHLLEKFQPNLVCILWNIGLGSLGATHFYSCSSTEVQKLKWAYNAIGKLDSHDFWKVHHTKINNLGKFDPNPMYNFQENGHNHLQLICIFLKIHYVGIFDFWCVGALD